MSETKVKALLKKLKTQPGPRIENHSPEDADEFEPIGLNGVLALTDKLLAVNRGLVPIDERDSLAFKRVHLPSQLIRERIKLDAGKTRLNILRRAAHRKDLNGIFPFAFDNYTVGQLVGNPLSMPLEEINPMHILEQNRRLTQMGPGGLSSDDMITEEAQNVHPSEFGFLSVLEGPESSRAGVDTRIAWGTRYGDDGRLYQQFKNKRTGKIEWLSSDMLEDKVVGVPE